MPMSLADPGQIVKHVYDETNEAIKVNIVQGTLTVTEQAIGQDGAPVPADSKVVAGKDDSGNTQTLRTNTSGNLQVDVLSSTLPTGAATSANQTTANASLSSIDGKTTVVNTGAVTVVSSSLPTGAATSALQTTTNSSLASIDAGIPAALGAATIANSMPVTIASDQTVPVSASSLPLPTGAATQVTLAALSAKSASSDITAAYDYTELSYIVAGNGTGEIGTVLYKLGGSAGTLVSTRTLAYDGSNRLISVTKS